MLSSRVPTILLAEDDDDLRALLADELVRNGFDVIATANGADAMTSLDIAFWSRGAWRLPDVLVTDLRMPTCDGYKLLEYAQYLPAIAITAFGDTRARWAARRAGARYVLDKPFDMRDLMAAIGRVLGAPGEAIRHIHT